MDKFANLQISEEFGVGNSFHDYSDSSEMENCSIIQLKFLNSSLKTALGRFPETTENILVLRHLKKSF